MGITVVGGDQDAAFPNGTVGGMKLRDYFAAAALQGICAAGTFREDKGGAVAAETAKRAYEIADAMLNRRGFATTATASSGSAGPRP